jgi:transposase-like protein
LIAVEIFRYRAELACPRCSSGNVDQRYRYMGEYLCRHCHYYWKGK